jgi:CTP synthase
LELEDGLAMARLLECDGMVVPGGFGSRGFEGKIKAIRTAREDRIPFLGICLGMQAAVIEYARTFAHIPKAHSAEFHSNLVEGEEDVVIFMPEGDRERMGGTMRLGARETILQKGSIARKLYGHERIMERHRHRYEVNPALVHRLEKLGLHFVGKNTNASGDRQSRKDIQLDPHPRLAFSCFGAFMDEFSEYSGLPFKSVVIAAPEVLIGGLLDSMIIFYFTGLTIAAVRRTAHEKRIS